MTRMRDSGGSPVSADLPYVKWLNLNGTGAPADLLGNYTSPTEAFYRIPDNQTFTISTVIIQVSDVGIFEQDRYGAMASALTNGLRFFIDLGGFIVPLLGGAAIKTNNDFFALTHHSRLTDFGGVAQTIVSEFMLADDYGGYLQMTEGQRFILLLQDNFTGLSGHKIELRGVLAAE